MSEKRKIVIKLLISAFVLGAVILTAYFLMRHFGLTDISRVEIQSYIESTGAIAPLIYIIISFLQVTFIPIPASITIIAGNYVFGVWEAYLYSYIGMMIASFVAFYLGRWIGRPFVNWLAGSREKVDGWLEKLKGREKILLFYMFFLPLFPDDLLCSIAGMLPITIGTFTVMQLITRATSIGATLVFMSGAVQGWAYVICLVIGALSVPIFIYCYKNVDKVNSFFARIAQRIRKK